MALIPAQDGYFVYDVRRKPISDIFDYHPVVAWDIDDGDMFAWTATGYCWLIDAKDPYGYEVARLPGVSRLQAIERGDGEFYSLVRRPD